MHSLTSLAWLREDRRRTADYFVTPAPVPCSVAVFSCACGATDVECDPETWQLLHFRVDKRVDKRRWRIFGQRTLPTDRIIKSGADVIIVGD